MNQMSWLERRVQVQDIELRPLQEFILAEVRREMAAGVHRLILQAATGLGKTVIAAKIIENFLAKNDKLPKESKKRALFICDRIVLVQQTSDVFLRYGIKHGVLQGDNPRFDMSKECQVCTIQTAKKRGVDAAELIIIDEAHVLHEAHKQIIKNNPNAYIIGLTATPYAKGLGKWFEKHIEPVPVKTLIRDGYLVPFEIYGPKVADLSKLKVRAGEFTEESAAETFDQADIVGDVIGTWQKVCPGVKTIAFGASVAHIGHLVEQFQAAGVTACQINAYQDEDERQEALDGFLRGNTTVLCSVEVATKGFDCPSVVCCILATATKSQIKWTQTTGRALRIFPGKEKAIVLDFGGNAERLGFPDDYQFQGLDDGKAKKKAEKTEKEERLPKACPSCDFIVPVGMLICPACGFERKRQDAVTVAEGDLEKLQRKVRKEYSVQDKQDFLAQLNQYAQKCGMKRHWKGFYGFAIYAYAEKFGCQPSGKMDWNARMPVTEEVKNWLLHRKIRYIKSKEKRGE